MFWWRICTFSILIGFATSQVFRPEIVDALVSFITLKTSSSSDMGIHLPPGGDVDEVWYDQTYFEKVEDLLSLLPEPLKEAVLLKLKYTPDYKEAVRKCEAHRPVPECDPRSPYRTYDGSCNNLRNPTWGQTQDCLLRLEKPAYNGAAGIPRSVTEEPLPEPRTLSLNIDTDQTTSSDTVSNLFPIFGQALSHDQSFSTPALGKDLEIACCSPSHESDFRCLPIRIPPGDPFYTSRNITCINFGRSLPCRTCEVGQRQIANKFTAAIDLSLIYGVSEEEAKGLRTNDCTGRLKSKEISEGEIFPRNDQPVLRFCPKEILHDCFRSGDDRTNQHTLLTSMSLLFFREHNRMADKLKGLHPDWSDREIYQNARRISGAKLQVIAYKEFLPILLGDDYMTNFGLWIGKGSAGTLYNHSIRFGVLDEHTTSGLRLHSMVSSVTGFHQFKTLYSNPYPIREGKFPEILHGLCRTAAQTHTRYEVKDVTNFLYKEPKADYGYDLAAVDIQRGRDHGLPRYLDIVRYCWKLHIATFDDLLQVMSRENVELLRNNYKSVLDIDLRIGIMMENLLKGTVVSKSVACIAAVQFYISKYGDRFFFEHENQVPSFTADQRETLKQTTFARIICDTTDTAELQRNVFLLASSRNPVLPCDEHPEVDLSLF